jgi:hypothetical protein
MDSTIEEQKAVILQKFSEELDQWFAESPNLKDSRSFESGYLEFTRKVNLMILQNQVCKTKSRNKKKTSDQSGKS